MIGFLLSLILWLLSNIHYVVLAVLGFLVIRWAWNQGVNWTSLGPGFWVALIWSAIIATVFFFVAYALLRFAPSAGRFLYQGWVDGANANQALPRPPGVGATPTPFSVQGLIQTPKAEIATAIATLTDGTPVPQGSTDSVTPVPGGGAQNLSGGGDYVVTDPSGATVRNACTSSATQLGTLPLNTVVTLSQPVGSNCVDGICQRATIIKVEPAVSFNAEGGCLHLAAVSPR